MKALKAISTIAFFIGIFMMAGTIGADDVAVQMHQAHTLDLVTIVIGMLACVPFIFVHGAW